MPEAPWNSRDEPAYIKQERRRMPGTVKRPNSGRQWSRKGDRKGIREIVKGLLIDNKTTEADSYRIETEKWEQFRRQANREMGSQPLWQIDLPRVSLVTMELDTWNSFVIQMIALEDELARYKEHLDG
jgi:hypothetical protein